MAHSEVKHDYHLVDPSPWPIVGSIGAFTMLLGAIFWMNKDYTGFWGLPLNGQPWVFAVGAVLVAYTMVGWWRDVIQESVVRGDHKPVVKLGLRFGMVLFIASEVMFFVAWFWAYFNSALFPHDVSIGQWPPAGIITLDPWHFPLMNTMILLHLRHDGYRGASRDPDGRQEGRSAGSPAHCHPRRLVHLRAGL